MGAGVTVRRGASLKTRKFRQENKVAKPNYRHAKKQKEAARKARQDAKQQRRSNAPEPAYAPDAPAEPAPAKPVE
jgi:hypothetical protein